MGLRGWDNNGTVLSTADPVLYPTQADIRKLKHTWEREINNESKHFDYKEYKECQY